MTRRGFTMIEVMMATALLGVVGAGIAAFLSAMATGTSARARVSDPSLEGAITMRRLAVVQFFTWFGLFCMWLFQGR